MGLSDAALQILINAKNNAKPELDALKGQVAGLSPGFATVAKGATAVGVALAALSAGRVAFELGEASAQSLRLSTSFDQLARSSGSSSQSMLSAMRTAAQGTVDDTTLIQSANRAMLLGVASTADEMAQLLEVAGARGKAMGLSTAQAFGDIVTGIGRMSPMILDNLGITVDAAAANEAYAASIGRTAASLTDAEQKQALLNAVIASSAGLMADNASQSRDMAGDFEAMRASLANAKDALGVLFTPAAAAIAQMIAEAATSATDAMVAMKENADMAPLRDQLSAAQVEVGTLTGELGGLAIVLAQLQDSGIATNQVMLGDWLWQMPAAIRGNRAAMTEWVIAQIDARGAALAMANTTTLATSALIENQGQVDSTVTAYYRWRDTSDEAAAAQQRVADAAAISAQQQQILQAITDATAAKMERLANIASNAAGSLRSSFAGISGVVGTGTALESYQKANAELKIMQAQWDQLNLSEDEIYFRTQEYVRSIQDANSELTKTVTHTAAVSKEAQEAQQAFDDLKSKVSGLLTAALDPGVGVDVDSLLPRQDDINEDARRLADVAVNGFESPWAEYLNNKFPELFQGAFEGGGDLKNAAAQALRNFQDGLQPELLDKDIAKERIKRMLLGDANIAELAAEIAQELSQEMGGQFTPEQIRQATGAILGAGGETEGEPTDEVGNAMLAGIQTNNTGAKLVAALAGQIKAGFETLTANAKEAGTVWGQGFTSVVKENVPPELVNILVALVTPEVYARLQTQQTQTGAES